MSLPKLSQAHLEHYVGRPTPEDITERYEVFYRDFEQVFLRAHGKEYLWDIFLVAGLAPPDYWRFTEWRSWNNTLKNLGKKPIPAAEYNGRVDSEPVLNRKQKRQAKRKVQKRWTTTT